MKPNSKLKRIASNTNLSYWHEETYDGYPLMVEKGPFIEEYLENLYNAMHGALDEYPRVFAFKFDLRFPSCIKQPNSTFTNGVLSRFKASMDAQISWDRQRARAIRKCSHSSNFRYFWIRELGTDGKNPHYHCIGFVNRDAYCTLGSFKSENTNLYHRLTKAWSGALGLSTSETSGAVHIPPNGQYHLTKKNYLEQDKLFYRCSYICKSESKPYGDGKHNCGGSRR